MKKTLLYLLLCVSGASFAQTNVYIHFTPKVGGAHVYPSDLGTTVYYDLNGVAFQIEHMSYYISRLKLTHDGGQEIAFDTPDDVKLVTISSYVFNLGQHSITNLESIDFGVGVPSDWNHLDINTYPTGHPLSYQLDPVMHWGWTAGYFHMALTAMGDNNADDVCDQMFETHCLGDANYKTKALTGSGQLINGDYHIYVDCNIDEWIYGTDPGTTGVQHTDTGVAITVMDNVDNRTVFEIPADLGIAEDLEVGKAWFTVTENGTVVNWKEMKGMDAYQLIDMNGRVVHQANGLLPAGNVTWADLQHGTYVFNAYNADGQRIHSMTVLR